MKILIDTDLVCKQSLEGFSAEEREFVLEEAQYFKDLCARFSVYAKFDFSESSVDITVLTQKVTLDEFAMNELFCEFIYPQFEFDMEYSALGGVGCDFCARIKSKLIP